MFLPSEMDKIALNNQIVLMRRHVKQAKIHTIHKFVKQLKLLKNRKGNEIQLIKNKRKAERLLEEISFLKKVRPDHVSKLALSKSKNWNEILIQKNSVLEDRCIALLASFEPVKKAVEIFYESKKDVVSKIPDLLKQWEEKSKFPKNSFVKKKSDFENTLKMNSKPLDSLNDKKNQSKIPKNQNNKSLEKESKNISLTSDHDLKKDNCTERLKHSVSVDSSHDIFSRENIPKERFIDSNDLLKNSTAVDKFDKLQNKPNISSENDSDNSSENDRDEINESDCDSESSETSKSENCYIKEKKQLKKFDSRPGVSSKKDPERKTEDTKVEKPSSELLQLEKKNSHIEKKTNLSASGNIEICSISKKLVTKKMKSGENKLKAITLLNLDELQDLEEIPVDNSAENDESGTEDDDKEDSSNDPSENDPFFLGRDEAVSVENTLIDAPKSSNFMPTNKIFDRRGKLNNQPDFKKPVNNSQSFKKDFSWDKKENKFKSFNDGKKFQPNSKSNFHQAQSKDRFHHDKQSHFKRNAENHKEFVKKTPEMYKSNKNRNFNNWSYKNEDNKQLERSKGPHKKDNIINKPLHPSWAAKRKEKTFINTFQGKKIKFED